MEQCCVERFLCGTSDLVLVETVSTCACRYAVLFLGGTNSPGTAQIILTSHICGTITYLCDACRSCLPPGSVLGIAIRHRLPLAQFRAS